MRSGGRWRTLLKTAELEGQGSFPTRVFWIGRFCKRRDWTRICALSFACDAASAQLGRLKDQLRTDTGSANLPTWKDEQKLTKRLGLDDSGNAPWRGSVHDARAEDPLI